LYFGGVEGSRRMSRAFARQIHPFAAFFRDYFLQEEALQVK
jgi:hypothetical protein